MRYISDGQNESFTPPLAHIFGSGLLLCTSLAILFASTQKCCISLVFNPIDSRCAKKWQKLWGNGTFKATSLFLSRLVSLHNQTEAKPPGREHQKSLRRLFVLQHCNSKSTTACSQFSKNSEAIT